MYFLNKFCCVCLNGTKNLNHVYDRDSDGISHYKKLTTSIAEMNFNEINTQRFICGECCVTLNTVYNFRQMCLRSKTNLITYISQLQTFSKVSGTISVPIKDISKEVIILHKEINIKCEHDESCSHSEEIYANNTSQNSIQTCISIKEENCENEKYFESDYLNTNTVDENINENAYCSIKVEDEHQTSIEDQFRENFEQVYVPCDDISSEMDTEETVLIQVKEESFTQSSQDGSTSREDMDPNSTEIVEESYMTSISKQKLIKCTICSKPFRYNCELLRHMRVHSGVKPYQCELCNKKFTKKSDLNRHILIHSGERPYECKLCWRKFTKNSDLTIHSRIHSGVRPYECNVCNKKFTKKSDMTRHLRIHSNDRPYECEICKKRFTQPNIVTSHMLLHYGQRQHQCEICNKSFMHKKNLKCHLRIHSGERPYECSTCSKTFTKNSDLTRHIRIHSDKKIALKTKVL